MDRARCLTVSDSNELLLERALTFLREQRLVSGVLVVAPTRGAADDFLFRATSSGISLAGVYRMTPAQLALSVATPALARQGLAPVSALGQQGLAARSAAQCRLAYFAPVVDTPGFAGALAFTLIELRPNRIAPDYLARQGDPGRDPAQCLSCYEEELRQRSLADRADILRLATGIALEANHPLLGLPTIGLSIAADSAWQRSFWRAVFSRAPAVLGAVLRWDQKSVTAIEDVLGVTAIPVIKGIGSTPLALASDLYSSPYASGEALRKDSKLAKAAAHYKISGERILRELKEGPTRQPGKSKDQKAASSEKPKVPAQKS